VDREYKSGSFIVSINVKASNVFEQGGARTQLNLARNYIMCVEVGYKAMLVLTPTPSPHFLPLHSGAGCVEELHFEHVCFLLQRLNRQPSSIL
jgi:hypothetical protein